MTEVQSPCIGICELDIETGFCVGCFRTREEVAAWGTASIEIKQQILERLKNRRSLKNKRARNEHTTL